MGERLLRYQSHSPVSKVAAAAAVDLNDGVKEDGVDKSTFRPSILRWSVSLAVMRMNLI